MHILSKFNAYNTHARTHAHNQGNGAEEKVSKRRKVFKEALKEPTGFNFTPHVAARSVRHGLRLRCCYASSGPESGWHAHSEHRFPATRVQGQSRDGTHTPNIAFLLREFRARVGTARTLRTSLSCYASSGPESGRHAHSEHRFPATRVQGQSRDGTHTPRIAFRHLPPNSARFSYATEGALFISAQLSTDAVSALRKV